MHCSDYRLMDIAGGNNNSIQLDFFILKRYVPFFTTFDRPLRHFSRENKKKVQRNEYVRE